MRNLVCSLLVALYALVFPAIALCCGMTTHAEICQRAVWAFASPAHPDYQIWVADYQSALQAGAVFPDWGYAFGYPDEAEAAHWSPFVNAAADYIRETYPRPWDFDTQMSAVFLLGVASHMVADDYFHVTGQREGFLYTMGQHDFHGSFEQAHNNGDFGGDVLCAYELDQDWKVDVWYVPSADMVAIYHELGYTQVTREILERYMGLMFLGFTAENAAWIAFPGLAHDSPFLVEQIQDYFGGGLDTMGAATAREWAQTIARLEGEDSSDATQTAAAAEPEQPLAGYIELGLQMVRDGRWELELEQTERGAYIRVTTDRPDATTKGAQSGLPSDAQRALTVQISRPYAYLGTSLAHADFNADGTDDLAIGAPGYGEPGSPQLGRVYLLNGRPDLDGRLTLDLAFSSADLVLQGAVASGRFGWSMAVVDLNADNYDDLAVSAPTVGAPSQTFNGAIHLFFGGPDGLSATADLLISTDVAHANLGWTLAAGDLDDDGSADLLAGAPFARAGGNQRGLAAVFLSGSYADQTELTLDDADWLMAGENDYDLFGHALHAPAGNQLLLVGAPGADLGDEQNAGRLYGFDFSGEPPQQRFMISGPSEFAKTGSSAAAGDPLGNGDLLLALGSVTATATGRDQAGILDLLLLDALSGNLPYSDLPFEAAFQGDQSHASLGWAARFADLNADGADELLLAAPGRERESGRVYVLQGDERFPLGAIADPATVALWTLDGTQGSKFGAGIDALDFNGDGVLDLAISARHDSSKARQSGQVLLLLWPKPRLSALQPSHARRGAGALLELSGERLFNRDWQIRLEHGDYQLPLTSLELNPDGGGGRLRLNIPAGAPLGAYRLVFENTYGSDVLEQALELKDSAGPDDSDDDEHDDSDEACCG